MSQQELIYGYNSIFITGVLFVLMVLFNEIGFRIGRFVQLRADTEVKSLTGSIQGSVLGLLALLLGFTFSMAMQRYDNRHHALIDEANAIGTAVLRVQLLPEQYRQEAHELLRTYVDVRTSMGDIDITKHTERKKYNGEMNKLHDDLWSLATAATHDDPRPVTTGAFVASLNGLIDSQGERSALLHMHVPEVILLLLFFAFISSGGILGYSSGLSGRRVVMPSVLVSFLIAMVVFIIIDLDRPRRGLIQVDQGMMLDLKQDYGD